MRYETMTADKMRQLLTEQRNLIEAQKIAIEMMNNYQKTLSALVQEKMKTYQQQTQPNMWILPNGDIHIRRDNNEPGEQ